MKIIRALLVGFVFMISMQGCSSTRHQTAVSKTIDNKIQLYMIYKDRCPSCISMKAHMSRGEVKELLQKHFTIKMINIRDKNALPKIWMRTHTAPTLYFLNSNKSELVSSIHGVSYNTLLSTLKEAIAVANMK